MNVEISDLNLKQLTKAIVYDKFAISEPSKFTMAIEYSHYI